MCHINIMCTLDSVCDSLQNDVFVTIKQNLQENGKQNDYVFKSLFAPNVVRCDVIFRSISHITRE